MPALTQVVQQCLEHQFVHLHNAVCRKDRERRLSLTDDECAFLDEAQIHPSAKQVSDECSMFTVYTMTAYCPITRRWWIVKKRYSEYHAFRKQIDDLWVHCELRMKHDPLTSLLRSIMSLSFPKKTYNGDNTFIVKERMRGLEFFLRKLMVVHAECFYYAYEKIKLDEALPSTFLEFHAILQRFLEVPKDMLDIYAMQRMLSHSLDNQSEIAAAETCSICLSTFAETQGEAIVQLTCSHIYHRDCVVAWLVTKKTCPLCREDIDSGSIL
ncbi:hypothetical protein THRCLA_02635 [Thraustotheca clavata]|uniref:RING-type domain-containing protein n=1 Tax=Thraustotheca clavata TaxID=74557 RepID=A0A1W0A4T8_9STRA|nr:hypothetical protein THRCLA_02635 [Thraustotheca clavata]